MAKRSGNNFSNIQRALALSYGVAAHMAFVVAVSVMIWSLYGGLQFGWGSFSGWKRWIFNLLLIAQFPLLHSFLLSRNGRPVLKKLAPVRIATQLQPTTYVLLASLQILIVFLLWSPDVNSAVWWEPRGVLWGVHVILYVTAWLLLGKSMWDAHLGIQTGYIGWLSVWRDQPKIVWPGLPTRGLFRLCRQPIYFSFMLTLWTGPVWTLDKVVIGALWSAYCFFGPALKEQRQERAFGDGFKRYKREVSFWPSLRSLFFHSSPAHPKTD